MLKLPASSAKDRVSIVKTLVLHDYVMQVSMKSSHHGFFEGEPRIRPSHFRQSTSQDRSWASCRPRADFASVTSAIAAALKAPYSLIMRYKGKKGAEPRKRTVVPLGTRP